MYSGELCSDCKDIIKCNKYCILHAGESLCRFIMGIDIVNTSIGDFRDNYIINGASYEAQYDSMSDIMVTDRNTMISISNKIYTKIGGESLHNIIEAYVKYKNVDLENIKTVMDRVKGINSNKIMCLPFKKMAIFKFMHEDDIGTLEIKSTYKSLTWKASNEDYKVHCQIKFRGRTKKDTVIFDFCDYMNKFFLDGLGINKQTSKYGRELIAITDCGFIKPIVIKISDKIELAVDGSFIYSNIHGETRVIGCWNNKGNIEYSVAIDDVLKKAVDFLNSNRAIVYAHRRFIAPYNMSDENIIYLKEID